MFVACWSVKGGSGTSVVAASLSLVLARRSDRGVLLVDLAGDLPSVLGVPDAERAGLADWCGAGRDVPSDGLARLETDVVDGLRLLGRGSGPLGGDRAELLVGLLASDPRSVVVDCGTVALDEGDGGAASHAALSVAASATHSLLVTRPCYVAVRRALRAPIRPSELVVVSEPGRSLDATDVEEVLGVPVWAEIAVEPAVARAVDAGLLVSRLPRALERALRRVA